ncbi:MAG: EF-P lysine aminoacylase GenX [Bdellovibrionales bacterium GWB1_52_6]|nr:MAG: EF-P lysine aminoacylase GenX [Bdellovibrionales bacterium GWB1_52_6]OFZ04610.1 MAG: EF-P lysine aminoacylase GenX [Bdellovibrionales bacterium GWA1_52_35]
MKWTSAVLDPRRLHGTAVRNKTERAIRNFFAGNDFREVRTPLLVPCPGMETHIRPFKIHREEPLLFLPTSPEFAMKRLLVGGLERIFQLSPAFRDEPPSRTHHPEFTMLEWYRAYAGYEEIMRDTEELLAFTAKEVLGSASGEIQFEGKTISVKPPWPRLRVRDLFLQHTGIDLTRAHNLALLIDEAQRLNIKVNPGENWDDVYFKIWLNLIEPRLPADQAVFVVDYPVSQAALAVLAKHADGTSWARRFEVYVGGIELCNAFEELTDPVEQRARFVKDMNLREQIYGPAFPKNPLDEDFLSALTEGMPPSGGNALGVDRLVMLLADEPDIHYTMWLS